MAKEKTEARPNFISELFQAGVYKRNQGKLVRQVTFSALAITLLIAAWRLWAALQANASAEENGTGAMAYAIPGVVLLGGIWLSYRLVNFPQFADFLISVEAELAKVSWPSKEELIRSSLVVIFMMFFLAIVLFGFDVFWQVLFKWLGVIQGPEAPPAN